MLLQNTPQLLSQRSTQCACPDRHAATSKANRGTCQCSTGRAADVLKVQSRVSGRQEMFKTGWTRIAEMLGLLAEDGSPDTGSCGRGGRQGYQGEKEDEME